MSLKDYEPRIAKSALHRKEEHVKQVFRDQVAEAAGLLEVVLSAIVLVALLLSVAPLLQLLPGLLTHGNSVEVREFLERALDIVIGIEFIKMLAKHSPGVGQEGSARAVAVTAGFSTGQRGISGAAGARSRIRLPQSPRPGADHRETCGRGQKPNP